jgi:hypothetical protein
MLTELAIIVAIGHALLRDHPFAVTCFAYCCLL